MRELAAIEALKSEKSEKEVSDGECGLVVDVDILACALARASTTDGHVWRFWTSKASCL
jgi:hypothetical protein